MNGLTLNIEVSNEPSIAESLKVKKMNSRELLLAEDLLRGI